MLVSPMKIFLVAYPNKYKLFTDGDMMLKSGIILPA